MQNFPERLIAARTAKNMTQEALANAVGVTRSTVSSWERGRTTPNLDMVASLSEALGCDLMRGTAVPEAFAAEDVPAAQPEAAPAPKPSRLPWLVAAAAVLVCVGVGLLLARSHRSAADRAETEAFIQYYGQTAANEAGKAYVAIKGTHDQERGESAAYDLYAFTLREENGIAFDIESATVKLQAKPGGHGMEYALSAADLAAAECDPHLEDGGVSTLSGGFPQGEFVRVGAEIVGKDENGNALTFTGLIDLTDGETE